jgi:hypothetical protein
MDLSSLAMLDCQKRGSREKILQCKVARGNRCACCDNLELSYLDFFICLLTLCSNFQINGN